MSKLVKRNNKKGFTLVELIVVIAIIAVLALILIPAISGYVGRATSERNRANVRAIYSQIVLINTQEGKNNEESIIEELNKQQVDLAGGTIVNIGVNANGAVISLTMEFDGVEVTFPDTTTGEEE